MDALLAFAVAAFVVVTVFVLLPSLSTRQSDRVSRLYAAEFAFSVLEEYRATASIMLPEGEDPAGWRWSLTERVVSPETPGPLDASMIYLEVTATVSHRDRPEVFHSATTVIARRIQ
jgi:hypothetical protein